MNTISRAAPPKSKQPAEAGNAVVVDSDEDSDASAFGRGSEESKPPAIVTQGAPGQGGVQNQWLEEDEGKAKLPTSPVPRSSMSKFAGLASPPKRYGNGDKIAAHPIHPPASYASPPPGYGYGYSPDEYYASGGVLGHGVVPVMIQPDRSAAPHGPQNLRRSKSKWLGNVKNKLKKST